MSEDDFNSMVEESRICIKICDLEIELEELRKKALTGQSFDSQRNWVELVEVLSEIHTRTNV